MFVFFLQMKTSSSFTCWKFLLLQKKVFGGLLLLAAILIFLPQFFNYIQQRNAVVLNDWLLNKLPSLNLSVPIFAVIWGIGFLMILNIIQYPHLLPRLLWGYIFILITRLCTLYFFPLSPPAGMLPLADPLTQIFYGGKSIDKDLFYSGHTATLCLFYLCIENRMQKKMVLAATILLGGMLLIQHIHYTVDVIAAPAFALLCFKMGLKLTLSLNKNFPQSCKP